MSISNTETEIECVIHWFRGWSGMQKGDFLKDLVDKANPVSIDTLFDSMHQLKVNDRPPSIFQCQLKLFTQWFESWTESDRNNLIIKLQEVSPDFVKQFNELVSTAS
ncbi:uncharacterized protein C14orf119-like [Mytilus edulis]|uniref:uncharacterized protein C14orf119-like n=1 Tax=Mytilus edulis TaxID=6550 RepID=UPI0039EE1651